MGHALTCGAHLESLRRTAVAEFALEDAHTLEELAEAARNDWTGESHVHHRLADYTAASPGGTLEPLESLFVHPRTLLPALPSVTADAPTVALIRSGRTINLPDVSGARQIKVFSDQRTLIAIATRIAGTLFHPKIVLSTQPAPDMIQRK
jgi:tRNA pseudouridine55 synthase